MQKKIGYISMSIIALFLITGLNLSASAATVTPNASYYLDYYSANTSAGTNGNIIVNFDVNATRTMSLVGSSYIVIQVYSNGVWTGVASYFGSTSNGMLAANTYSQTGSMIYQGISGQLYRALVTVYAEGSYGSDSRQVVTNSVYAY